MSGLSADAAVIAASDLFDPEWYALQRPGAVPPGQDAAEHYLLTGAAQGLEPGPGFSGARYLEANPDVAAVGMNPLLHYLQYGQDEGRCRFPVVEEPPPFADALEALAGSPLFDPENYLDTYPDVRASGMDPLRHYLEHGAREGRVPHPYFDTRHYQARYMAADDDGNPLLHYLRSPANATAETSPLFDGRFYSERHPDVAPSGMTPLEHFLVHGLPLRRRGHAGTAGLAALPRTVDGRRVCCTVVVPVHDAHDAVAECLAALLRNTAFGGSDRLLIVDDASTDPRIGPLLASVAGLPGIRVVTNPQNLGYTRTINRAIGLAGDDDVVLLNSDTVVGPNWLARLKATAWRHDRIGTVTAVSNAAGEFSVPAAGNAPAPDFDPDTLARAVADSGAEPFEVPTGNGFCMYVRRDLLVAIGAFDETAFPTGYGEENDFCMRAGSAGWANLVDPSVYVQHRRSASFGERREALAEAGFRRVLQMHPGYAGAIRAIATSPGFIEARYRIARQFRRLAGGASPPRPRILYVISTRVGGTPQTNADLMHAVAGDHDAIALCSDGRALEVLRAVGSGYEPLERHALAAPLRFASHASLEYDAVVAGILRRWNVELMHIRHLAWHGLGLVDVARGQGVPVVFSFHDYYPVCPTVNLLDEDGVLHPRGVPERAPNPLWHDDPTVPPMTPALLAAWQGRMQQALAGVDAFVTTTAGARQRVCDALPAIAARGDDFHVIAHGRDFARFGAGPDPAATASARPLRVLLAGNLSTHKGADLVGALRRRDVDGRFEFHVLGSCPRELAPYVVEHGPYPRDEFHDRVERIAPDLAAVLSIWPETYCHILTECWASGLPVLGVDIGAVGERIRQHGGGWLVGFPASAEALHERLAAIADSPSDRLQRLQEVRRWQAGEGSGQSTRWMAARYVQLYRDVLARHRQHPPPSRP